jgi:hypothetical protein
MNTNVWIIGIAIVAGFAAGALGSWFAASSREGAPVQAMSQEASTETGDTPSSGAFDSPTGKRAAIHLNAPDSIEDLADRQVQLEAELARVQAELEDLSMNLASRVQSSMREQAESRRETFRDDFLGRARERQEARLLEAGFTEQQANAFMARQEEAAMERLYLRDQAAREGWLDTERYQAELAKLPTAKESIRQDLSESDYDKYLFATLQRNRVTVTNVMQGSPAQSAGVQPGDMIYSLDGQRVFENDDLLRISSEGRAGEAVSLEVIRDGEKVALYVPRGPLGVNSMPQVADPETNASELGRFGFGARAFRGRGAF